MARPSRALEASCQTRGGGLVLPILEEGRAGSGCIPSGQMPNSKTREMNRPLISQHGDGRGDVRPESGSLKGSFKKEAVDTPSTFFLVFPLNKRTLSSLLKSQAMWKHDSILWSPKGPQLHLRFRLRNVLC